MQKCCIKGCDSHKYIGKKNIGFFPFPVHDEILLKKWLKQIDLPNWKPGVYHHVCSMHFRGDDVDSHPNRKQPFLNPTSIPTIFPGQDARTVSVKERRRPAILTKTHSSSSLGAVNVAGNGNCDMSMSQPTPVILIPTLIAAQKPGQFPSRVAAQNCIQVPVQSAVQIATPYTTQIVQQNRRSPQSSAPVTKPFRELPNASEMLLQQSSSLQLRLRKILPKPDPVPIANAGDLPKVGKIIQPLSVTKPDIPVLPQTVNANPHATVPTVPSSYPGHKRPVLRISINKQRNSDSPEKSPCASNEKVTNSSSDETAMNDSMDQTTSSAREITIENPSTNRTVTFRLDPQTGEIVATTQQMKESKTMKNERKVDDTYVQPSAGMLRQLYKKSQRECDVLRKRLKMLRQRHREEQAEIEKLQEHLIQIGDKVQKTRSDDIASSRDTQREETEKGVRSSKDEDYENFIREVKRIKQDIGKTRRGVSTMTNGELETNSQEYISRLTVNNDDSELLEDNKDNSSKFRQTSYEKIVDEINEKCSSAARTMKENSIDLKSYAGSDDTIGRDEFLHGEFLFE